MRKILRVVGAVASVLLSGAAYCDEALERAIELTSEQRYTEAREVLDSVLERSPDYSYARLLHGILRARAGRLNEAIQIFEQLRNDHPDMPEPYNNLAVLYAVQGRLDDAREVLMAMLEREPNAIAYANLGDVYASLARRAYERARELDPDTELLSGARLDPKNSMPEIPVGSTITAAIRTDPSDVGTGSQDNAAMSANPRGERLDSATVQPEREPQGPKSGGVSPGKSSQDEAVASMKPPGPAGESPDPGTEEASGSQDGVEPTGAVAATRVAPATAPSAAAPESSQNCALVRGFKDRRAVTEAANWLRSHGVEVAHVHDDRREVTTMHQVYLPPLSSRDEAYSQLREIRERGVNDVAVIEGGDQANGVSFGVYASIENARRRVSAMQDLGYEVQTGAARVEVVDEFMIEARASARMQDVEAAWTPKFADHPIQPVDCG